MERTKRKRTVDAILTADWHLMETNPVCRKDDLTETQWEKVDFIAALQKEYGCPVIHAGDLFDFWKPSPELLAKAMQHLPNNFWTVYGNHDLPQHNIELAYKSGIHALLHAGKLQVLDTCHWLETPTKHSWAPIFGEECHRKTLVWHVMTYQGLLPFPGCTAPKGAKLLRQYSQFDLIVTGDNHKPFVEEYEGRLLVNPGSLFRITAIQQTHKPRVYLWNGRLNTVEPVYLPIKEDVISREHLEATEERDNRIDAFISTINTDWEGSLSFEDNLEIFRQENSIRQSVMEIVYAAIDN
jgi:DNA repair exonuclease SbcCD nuclease subunit